MHINLIKIALTNNAILLGDFNLDYAKQFDINYAHKMQFEDFDEILADDQLIQLKKTNLHTLTHK